MYDCVLGVAFLTLCLIVLIVCVVDIIVSVCVDVVVGIVVDVAVWIVIVVVGVLGKGVVVVAVEVVLV